MAKRHSAPLVSDNHDPFAGLRNNPMIDFVDGWPRLRRTFPPRKRGPWKELKRLLTEPELRKENQYLKDRVRLLEKRVATLQLKLAGVNPDEEQFQALPPNTETKL